MPSKSRKQHMFMEAIAHDPAFARRAGVAQSVGKDFAAADKGRDIKSLPERVDHKAHGGVVESASPKPFRW